MENSITIVSDTIMLISFDYPKVIIDQLPRELHLDKLKFNLF